MDLYHLREEAEPSDRTALESVVDHIKEEMARLNVRRLRPACLRSADDAPAQALEEEIMSTVGPGDERLEAIYERLEELDPNTFEARA